MSIFHYLHMPGDNIPKLLYADRNLSGSLKRIRQDGQNVKYSVLTRVSGHTSPVANKRLYQILAEGGFLVKYVKHSVTSPSLFFLIDLNKMLIFCFKDNLNCKVEGLILRDSS